MAFEYNRKDQVFSFEKQLNSNEFYQFINGDDTGATFVRLDPSYELTIEQGKIIQRRIDGLNAYSNICAELNMAQRKGALSRLINRGIKDALIHVREELIVGDWQSALEELEEVGVGGYISQAMYTRFHTSISNYLQSENYK
jgi:hypothetical protein